MEAVQLLTQLLAVAELGGWMGDVIEILALQALGLQAQGGTTQALTTLERALALAEPEGYVRIFVDEGAPMAALLAQSVEGRAQSDPLLIYIEHLLRAFPEPQRQAQIVLRSPMERSDALIEPLSERELEVLRLLAAGLESPEIARELIIGVSTARTHIKNIYGKLACMAASRRSSEGALGIGTAVAIDGTCQHPRTRTSQHLAITRPRECTTQTRAYPSLSIPIIPYQHPLYAG
jgi:LuxR family transcriptional regulator, maltose regulon positive regulatory protein